LICFIDFSRKAHKTWQTHIENKVRRHLHNFNTLEAIMHAPTHTRRSYWRRG